MKLGVNTVLFKGVDVKTAMKAIKAAGSADPAAIKAALGGVTYTGVSGSIAFDDIGDAIRDTAYIKHSVNDGTWELETVQTSK